MPTNKKKILYIFFIYIYINMLETYQIIVIIVSILIYTLNLMYCKIIKPVTVIEGLLFSLGAIIIFLYTKLSSNSSLYDLSFVLFILYYLFWVFRKSIVNIYSKL
jgi:4-hydroxybenzoate polyprenyltransferase